MKLTKIKLVLTSLLLFTNFSLIAVPAAYATDLKGDACAGLNTLDSGSTSTNCGNSGEKAVGNLIGTIVDILSWVVGIAAVIMIIIAGFGFITAGGESSKITSARHTLIYALVGLLIVAAAQFLVHFAVHTSSCATGDTSKGCLK